MKFKTIGLKLATAVMTAAIAMQSPLTALQASAATAAKYLSEVILSYGNNDTEAKNWLKQNGYTVVDQNLNDGGYGGYEAMSWLGIASTRRSVYLGYKTTTDANEAITDMKIMNMNGGYSLQAYEQVLEQTKREKEHFLENLMAALEEYRANYKAGKVNAKIAHDNLNKFRDDDSGQLMGDLLLNTLKTEDEAAWKADPTQHADMVTILMQGNSTCVSEIMQNLAIAQDTTDDSWLTRAIDKLNAANAAPAKSVSDTTKPADSDTDTADTDTDAETAGLDTQTETDRVYYKNGLELMIAEMQEQFPTYNKQAILAILMAEYDKDAKMMASSLVGLANLLSNYTKSGLSGKATKEEADAYFAVNEFENANKWATAYTLFELLQDNWYGTTPLLNYLVYHDYDYLSDSAYLEDYAEYSLPQRAMLYPLVAQMTEGQRSLLEYTAMNRMVTMGLMDEEAWSSTEATMQDPEYGATDLEVCSVYAEVDRNDFTVGSIAVTNMAQGKQASTGEAMDNGMFGIGVSYLSAGIAIGGLAVSVAGAVLAAKNWGTNLAGESLTNLAGESLTNITNGQEAVLTTLVNSAETISEDIGLYYRQMAHFWRSFNAFKDKQDLLENLRILTGRYTQNNLLTVSGGNANISFDASFSIKELNNNEIQIITYDGTVFDTTDMSITKHPNYDRWAEYQNKINPDLIKQTTSNLAEQQAENILKNLPTAEDFSDVLDTFEWSDETINEFLTLADADSIATINFQKLSADQLDEIASFMTDNHADQNYINEFKKIVDAKKNLEKGNSNAVVDKVDDIAENGDKLADQADDVMTAATGSSFWKWFGVGMAIFGLVMSAYGVYSAISDAKAYYHVEMLPIPRKMVDLGWQLDGSSCYIYYDCTKCNRAEVGMKNDTLGDYGDMNGDVMKEWLALYTTKDKRAGDPIKAGITVKKGTSTPPVNTVPLSFFGFESAVNMTDTAYTYNNDRNGIYLYYKTDVGAGYTGTVMTRNALITTSVLSAISGAGLCGLIVALTSKRKKKASSGEPTAA